MDEGNNSAHMARFAKLENSLRLAWLALVILAALFAIGWSGNRTPAADLDVRRLRLVDEIGRVRAELRIEEGSPVFAMKDEEGVDRLILVHDVEQTALYIHDDKGDTRLGAAQFAHGGGGFALHGQGVKGAAVLYLKGTGSLTMYDADGGIEARFPPQDHAE